MCQWHISHITACAVQSLLVHVVARELGYLCEFARPDRYVHFHVQHRFSHGVQREPLDICSVRCCAARRIELDGAVDQLVGELFVEAHLDRPPHELVAAVV